MLTQISPTAKVCAQGGATTLYVSSYGTQTGRENCKQVHAEGRFRLLPLGLVDGLEPV